MIFISYKTVFVTVWSLKSRKLIVDWRQNELQIQNLKHHHFLQHCCSHFESVQFINKLKEIILIKSDSSFLYIYDFSESLDDPPTHNLDQNKQFLSVRPQDLVTLMFVFCPNGSTQVSWPDAVTAWYQHQHQHMDSFA